MTSLTRKRWALPARALSRLSEAAAIEVLAATAYARTASTQPVDPKKAVFASAAPPTDDIAEAIRHLDERGMDARFCTLAQDGAGFAKRLHRRIACAREAATAAFLFIDDSVAKALVLPLRSGTRCFRIPGARQANEKRPTVTGRHAITENATPATRAAGATPATCAAGATSPASAAGATGPVNATDVISTSKSGPWLAAATGAPLPPPAPRRPAADALAERDPAGIDISIVIPAYNAQATLRRAVESALAQDYPRGRMEVIVVDDCSTDATYELARGLERAHPGAVRALRTHAQSGTPARPRNLGLAFAHGTYVFFLDADDWLGEEAVPRMLARALQWGSDVLLVKLVGEGGRDVPKSMFAYDQPAADLRFSNVMRTFGPYKLYRRALVQNLRFPEGCMPEDIGFVLRAYEAARVVSVAADYGYYHLALAEGEDANCSFRTWDDVESNLRAYGDLFGFVGARPALARNATLMRRLFERDVLNTVGAIAREPDERAACGQLRRLLAITGRFYDARTLSTLPAAAREVLSAVYE